MIVKQFLQPRCKGKLHVLSRIMSLLPMPENRKLFLLAELVEGNRENTVWGFVTTGKGEEKHLSGFG